MNSFEQERQEVLDSVFQALSRHVPDPHEMAACAFLMRHLNAEPIPSPAPVLQSVPKAATHSLHGLQIATHCSVS